MKMISKYFLPKLIALAIVLACSGISRTSAGLHAQASLGFGTSGLMGMPDSAWSSSNQIQVPVWVRNFDSINVYSDTIQIGGYIDTASFQVPFSFPPVTNISVAPLDSVSLLLPFVFLDNQMGGDFRIGNNVIVVWPISFDPNFGTHDSIFFNILILDPSGVPNHSEEDHVRFYPVPANGPLYVTTGTREYTVKQVVVRDAAGKIVAISNTPAMGIKTDDWASGIYLLEITFENGQKSSYKIIR